MTGWKRIDSLFLVYLAISTILGIFAGNLIIRPYPFIWIRVFIILFIFICIYFDNKSSNPVFTLIRNAYPLIVSGYFYAETVFYNKLFFKNLDPLLVQVEKVVFGMQPSLGFSTGFSNRLFSELMYIGYFSFYVLILGFTLYVFIKKRDYFVQAVFQLGASLYIFYLLFCLFPSEGPQFYFTYPDNVLPEAFIFNHIMYVIQCIAEQPTGAFPSSHVGISVIILILSKKHFLQFFKLAWLPVLILIFSTVYIKAHYAIDVAGGLMVAPLILYISNYLYRLPIRKKSTPFNLIHNSHDKT